MRYNEIILKLMFLAGAIYFIVTKNVNSAYFFYFLLVSLILGAVLILNKDASYHFKQSKRDLKIRKVEGALMIIFAVVISFIVMNPA